MSRSQRSPGNEPDATAPFPFPTAERHDAPPATSPLPVTEPPTEDALDHGIEESFPASDPVSVHVSKAISTDERKSQEERGST